MDQTISKVMYEGRINDTVRKWNESGNVGGGTIVASNGYTYKMVNGRLVLITKGNPELERAVKVVTAKVKEAGLLKTSAENAKEAVTSEFVVGELCN